MALLDEIITSIQVDGPMPVSDYMARALLHPEYGYYTCHEPFGVQGDFITAPEISQLFGEMLGIWVVYQWQQLGMPARFTLMELGPGRGTLMADMLRVIRQQPACYAAATVQLVEASPAMVAKQKKALTAHEGKVVWISEIASPPMQPLLFVCNEFFDALPIEQYVYRDGKWLLRCVITDAESQYLRWHDVPCGVADVPDGIASRCEEGVHETSPASIKVMQQLAQQVKRCGGAGLIVDYGYCEHSVGDTLQAVREHKYHSVLETPGKADITAHVNFAALADVAQSEGLAVKQLTTQQAFLEQMGITVRLQALCQVASTEQQRSLTAGVERLLAPDKMGTLFKVMELGV